MTAWRAVVYALPIADDVDPAELPALALLWGALWRGEELVKFLVAQGIGLACAREHALGTPDVEVCLANWLDVARLGQALRVVGEAVLLDGIDRVIEAYPRVRGPLGAVAEAVRVWGRPRGQEAFASLVHNHLRGVLAWSEGQLAELRWPVEPWFGLVRPLRRAEALQRDGGALRSVLAVPGAPASAWVLSHDPRCVVSLHRDGAIRVWDLDGGACLRTLAGLRLVGDALSLSSDGRYVVVFARDAHEVGQFEVRELASGAVVSSFACGFVQGFAPWPDGRHLVVVGEAGVELWDIAAGTRAARLAWQPGRRDLLDGAPLVTRDGEKLLVSGRFRGTYVWDVATRAFLGGIPNLRDVSRGVAADGQLLLVGGAGSFEVYDLSAERSLGSLAVDKPLTDPYGHVLRLLDGLATVVVREAPWEVLAAFGGQVTRDGRTLVTGRNGVIHVWTVSIRDGGSLPAREARTAGEGHADRVTGCVVTPDGAAAVTFGADHTARVWARGSERCERWLVDRPGPSRSVALPDGSKIACLSEDARTLTLFHRATGIVAGSCEVEGFFGWTRDGHHFAVRDETALRIYDLERLEPASPSLPVASATAWCLTSDRSAVVVSIPDEGLAVFARDTGELLDTFPFGHAREDTWIVALAAGDRVASGGPDAATVVWGLARRERVTLDAGGSACGWLSADGRDLFVSRGEGRLDSYDAQRHGGGRYSESEGGGGVPVFAQDSDSLLCARVVGGAGLRVQDLGEPRWTCTIRGQTAFTTVGVMGETVIAGDAYGDVWLLAPHGRSRS